MLVSRRVFLVLFPTLSKDSQLQAVSPRQVIRTYHIEYPHVE